MPRDDVSTEITFDDSTPVTFPSRSVVTIPGGRPPIGIASGANPTISVTLESGGSVTFPPGSQVRGPGERAPINLINTPGLALAPGSGVTLPGNPGEPEITFPQAAQVSRVRLVPGIAVTRESPVARD